MHRPLRMHSGPYLSKFCTVKSGHKTSVCRFHGQFPSTAFSPLLYLYKLVSEESVYTFEHNVEHNMMKNRVRVRKVGFINADIKHIIFIGNTCNTG